ncbi:MAG: hypothetical protein M3203_00470 [Actinomycetota bacterium]|nr:hypothetical protein [Actinomycetota bacterium]
MRAGAVVAAVAAVLLASCTGRAGDDGGGPATSVGTTSTVPSTTAPTVTTTTTTASAAADPAGSVTLRVTGLTLPDVRAGGTGLRLVVRAVSPPLRVRRTGGGGAVSACPVDRATTPATGGDCVDLGPGATVELASTGGVELRAAAGPARVDEVGVTYVPVDRSTTIVTPARPAGTCSDPPCRTTFSLTPGRPGPFTLDGRAGGGRPRLVLVATPSGRVLATVEGGGLLSIRATLEPGAEASLLHHEHGTGPVAPVTAEIFWP